MSAVTFGAPLDIHVMSFIHSANLMEVQMTQMALSKTSDEDIQAYAKSVQADHQKADQKLLEIAKQEKLEVKEFVPETEEEKADVAADQALMKKLSTLEGDAFDQAFLDGMYDGHVKVIKRLQGWRTAITIKPLGALIDEVLPTLELHRDQADELRKEL